MASQQVTPQLEATAVQKEVQQPVKVVASGSAFINPHVDNAVYITFDLIKKKRLILPYPVVKVKVMIGDHFGPVEQNLSDVINAMPEDQKERVDVKYFFPHNTRVHDKKLTYELVDEAPFGQADFLVSLATSVDVVPNPKE